MFNNKNYVFNMDSMMEFVFDGEFDRTNDSEITETYINDEDSKELVLINKQLREIKGSENSAKFTIRYDLLKTFIETIITIDNNAPSTLGEELVFNTMVSENLIKEVNE